MRQIKFWITDFSHTVDKNDDFKLFHILRTDEIRNVNVKVEDNKNGSDNDINYTDDGVMWMDID